MEPAEFSKSNAIEKMTKTDWIWAIGLLVFGLTVYFGITPVSTRLAKIPFFRPPDFFPLKLILIKHGFPVI